MGIKCVAVVGGAARYEPGYIYTSANNGDTWTQRATYENWVTVASSRYGDKLVAIKENYNRGGDGEGGIYLSDNSGVSWRRIDYHEPSRHHISNDDSGNIFASMAAPDDINGRFIYASTARGNGWEANGPRMNWSCGALSSDGSKLAALEYNGFIYTSTNLGRTLTSRTFPVRRAWSYVASSTNGSSLAAVVDGGFIYTSTNTGVTWTERAAAGSRRWRSIASSQSGRRLVAVASGDRIYISQNGGKTWTATGASNNWTSVAATRNFKLIVAVARGAAIAVSKNYGKTWATKGTVQNWSAVACQA
eukprot:gene5559-5796_t